MTIQHSTHDSVAIISPVGRIDTTTSGILDDAIRRTVDEGARDLLVDLSSTEYISSAGLRVFLVLAKRLGSLGGRLVLCGMGEPVRQVFQLAGFMPIFTVEPSRSVALSRLTRVLGADETAALPAVGRAQS
jgi:stage II sporulation protein AA (anti-sigma F factor antagonist)